MTMRTSIFGLALTFLLSTASFALPNPAAQNCIDNGGSLQTRDDHYGQYGVCFWRDLVNCGTGLCLVYSECEEWALLRGQCKKGDCGLWQVTVDADGHEISDCAAPVSDLTPIIPPPVA